MDGTDITVFTLGHSTRSLDELVGMLRAWSVGLLVDVRTVPRSRRHPQFNREALAEALPAAGIGYRWVRELGGWRRPSPHSPNGGWRLESFRGYADYMLTPEFETALSSLIELAARQRTAMMCAEAVRWRCHRTLIADALSVRGVDVRHIMSESRAEPHRLTPFADVHGTRITYPPAT